MQGMNPHMRGVPAGTAQMTEQQRQAALRQQAMMKNQQQPGGSIQGLKKPTQPGGGPRKGEKKIRDPNAKNSARRPINYIRLRMVQQYFKASELKVEEKEENAATGAQPALYADGQKESNQDDEKDQEAQKEANEVENNEETSKQAEDQTAVDDRGEEVHDDAALSDRGQEDNDYANNCYDPNEVMALDINSKSKARCLQRLILDKKVMKKANILLFK